MSKTSLETPKVRWDLSALFSGIDDPKIEQTWAAGMADARSIADRYRGRIDSEGLTAEVLSQALHELEALYSEISKPLSYSNLLFATDSASPAIGAFLQKQKEKATELSVILLFFELELQAAPEELISSLLRDDAMANYAHYVRSTRAFSAYRLAEPEEIILEETANTGSRAWVRLFEEVTSNHVYRLHRPGVDVIEETTMQELVALLRDPDRATRLAAADAFTAGLKEQERVLVFIYNNLLQDKAVEDRLRKLEYPEKGRHLSNELEKETVDLVVRLCRKNYSLVERFYLVKREILGLPELTHVDRYAPLFDTEAPVAWEEAQRIVLGAFGSFSQTMEARAAEFFDRSWIDAEPRKGKQGGAFCAYNTPDTHPVVFQSYLNRMDDVMTLAHELGHGVHASLSRSQSYFNFQGTLPLAELASTFGEMLVFEKLVDGANLKDRLALYADKIEGVFATVFRQSAMFAFEQSCHQTRRQTGELSPEQFGELWQNELQAMFGSSVKLGEQHRMWWSYIGHFIFAPFYVYAYSFGELLVLSLYQMAKMEGPAFAERYVDVLKLGGSKSPKELMALVGVDLDSEEFWHGGFRAMEALVGTFEQLWAEYRSET